MTINRTTYIDHQALTNKMFLIINSLFERSKFNAWLNHQGKSFIPYVIDFGSQLTSLLPKRQSAMHELDAAIEDMAKNGSTQKLSAFLNKYSEVALFLTKELQNEASPIFSASNQFDQWLKQARTC